MEKKTIYEHFCYEISNGNYDNIHFSYDGVEKMPRVILKGRSADVLRLVNAFEGLTGKD